jgi:hypothetical protein
LVADAARRALSYRSPPRRRSTDRYIPKERTMSRHRILVPLLMAAGSVLACQPAWAGPSVFLSAPDDSKAITVNAVGDGRADDTAAIQAALDSAASRGAGSIVYLPSGRYRITRTLVVSPGTRVFGVGKTRPVLVLPDNTPGFQDGVKNMVIFAGGDHGAENRFGPPPFSPPGSVPFDPTISDSNPGSFYSAMANVDFKIGRGNPAATALRFHAAQHAYLKHMEFDIGSGFAGLYMVGNEAEDLHFRGGRYGIVTEKPSPAWSFTLVDSTFEGQRDAGIREHEAGLTMLNVAFRDVPVGVEIDEGYGDWLFGEDVRFENVSKAGIVVSNENNAFTQVSFLDAQASNTPVFARFRDSGRTVGRKGTYTVGEFTYGRTLPGLGQFGPFETRFEAVAGTDPSEIERVVPALPPTSEWTNVRDLGVKGDAEADDTAALQAAIDSHRVLYFPSGFYKVSDTLRLRPDTVLIGLHPSTTQIRLADESEGYQGVGAPKALIASAKGGNAIVTGIGISTGGINRRATALLWKAGEDSLVDDVKILGGHGTFQPDGTRFNPYDPYHAGDEDPRRRWDVQYPSFWVTDGGGGTFINLWAANTYAQAGFYVSDTETPGRLLQLSAEHHGRLEIGLNRAKNWGLYGPQTEEEVGESKNAVSLEIRNSSDILVANYHGYRVTRTVKPARAAVELQKVDNIRFRNVHVNAESGLGTRDDEGQPTTFLRASKYPYENAIYDLTSGLEVREREFAVLDVKADPAKPAAQGPAVEKLADGFWSVAGGAIDSRGKLYFVDRYFQRIYGWSAQEGLSIERDNTLDPVNLAIDASDNIVVLSSDGEQGTVYSFKPGSSAEHLTVIPPTPADAHGEARVAIPVNYWNNGEFKDQYDPESDHFTTLAEMFARDAAVANAREYVSPDGSLALPAYPTFRQGPPNHLGTRWSNALQTYGFITAKPGDPVYVTNGSEIRTYRGTLGEGGAIVDLKPFANRGGESVAVGPDGTVYVANGQVFVYAPDGSEAGRIDVPERPLQLLFGGEDGRTLFILAHHALYSVRI